VRCAVGVRQKPLLRAVADGEAEHRKRAVRQQAGKEVALWAERHRRALAVDVLQLRKALRHCFG
jgi:hypothetical protein